MTYENAYDAACRERESAGRILKSKTRFDHFLEEIEEKLRKIPNVGSLLADVPLLISLVKSYVEGQYKAIPYNAIIAVVAALLYVLSPVDIVPDFIPGVGFLDDAAVIAFCVSQIHEDLEEFKAWRDGIYVWN